MATQIVEKAILGIFEETIHQSSDEKNKPDEKSVFSEELEALGQALTRTEQELSAREKTFGNRLKTKVVHAAKEALTPDPDFSLLDLEEETTSITSMVHRAHRTAENYGASISESQTDYFQNKKLQDQKLTKAISDNIKARNGLHDAEDCTETAYDQSAYALKLTLQAVGIGAVATSGIGLAGGIAVKLANTAHKAHLEKTNKSLQARQKIELHESLPKFKSIFLDAVDAFAEKQKTLKPTEAVLSIDYASSDAKHTINQAKTYQEAKDAFDLQIERIESFYQEPNTSSDIDPNRLHRLKKIALSLQKEQKQTDSDIATLQTYADDFAALCAELNVSPDTIQEDIRNKRIAEQHAHEFKQNKDLERVASYATTTSSTSPSAKILRKEQHKAIKEATKLEHKLNHLKNIPLTKPKRTPILSFDDLRKTPAKQEETTRLSEDNLDKLLNHANRTDNERLNYLKEKQQGLEHQTQAIEYSIRSFTEALNKHSAKTSQTNQVPPTPQKCKVTMRKETHHVVEPKEKEPSLMEKLNISKKDAKKIIALQKQLELIKTKIEALRKDKHSAMKQEQKQSKFPAWLVRLFQNRHFQPENPIQPSDISRAEQMKAEKRLAQIRAQLKHYDKKYPKCEGQWDSILANIQPKQATPTPVLKYVSASLRSSVSTSITYTETEQKKEVKIQQTRIATITEEGFNLQPEAFALDDPSPTTFNENPLFINQTPKKIRAQRFDNTDVVVVHSAPPTPQQEKRSAPSTPQSHLHIRTPKATPRADDSAVRFFGGTPSRQQLAGGTPSKPLSRENSPAKQQKNNESPAPQTSARRTLVMEG